MPLKRILVRLPGAKLGDFLMTTPALAGLRETYPNARITLLLWPPEPGAWLEGHPLFDEMLWDDQEGAYSGTGGALRLLARIRAHQFDAAVSLYGGGRYAWLFRLANIPLRVGCTRKSYGRLFTHNFPDNRSAPDRHEVEYNFDMMRPLGVSGAPGPMVYPVTAAEDSQAIRLLAERGWDGAPFVIVNPTHGGSSRLWPPERFAAASRQIVAETGARLALIGVPMDREGNARIAVGIGPGTLDLTGDTSVGVLGAILRRSALHLSVDTGTAHLAAAMGVPCVTVFPASQYWDERIRWSPWMTETRVLGPTVRCTSCRLYDCNRAQTACIDSIAPEAVARAAMELLAAGPTTRSVHRVIVPAHKKQDHTTKK